MFICILIAFIVIVTLVTLVTLVTIKLLNNNNENFTISKEQLTYNELPSETKEALSIIPKFTSKGFTEPKKLDDKLYDKIYKFYKNNYHKAYTENKDESKYTKNFNNIIIKLDDSIIKEITNNFMNLIKSWTKIENLEHTSTFGIREYKKNSILPLHTDRKETHILSAIINIEQDNEWNLEIYDHDLNRHLISLKPGEYILYESATCLHGRPTNFKGNKYANIFTHFKIN